MNDHDALLAAVLANPEDDLPRLVFADWMEESGQPALIARAHFIRAQIEAASLPEDSRDRRACDRKATELLREYGAGWNAAFPNWVTWKDTEVRYHRGFVSELATIPRRLFRDADELATVAPLDSLHIRTVNTTYNRNSLAAIAKEWPWFARIRTLRVGPGLSFWTNVGPPEPQETPELFLVTRLKKLTGVRKLTLAGNQLPDEWVVSFATQLRQVPFVATLRELDLSRNRITDAAAHTLATARGLDQLVKLDLRRNRITRSGKTMLRRRFEARVEV